MVGDEQGWEMSAGRGWEGRERVEGGIGVREI